jgi:hypothetical protein
MRWRIYLIIAAYRRGLSLLWRGIRTMSPLKFALAARDDIEKENLQRLR